MKGPLKIDDKVTDEDFGDAVVTILTQCAKGKGAVEVAAWAGGSVGGAVDSKTVALSDVAAAVQGSLASFQGKGGAVLLTYSMLLTRGVDQVRKDIIAGGGDRQSS